MRHDQTQEGKWYRPKAQTPWPNDEHEEAEQKTPGITKLESKECKHVTTNRLVLVLAGKLVLDLAEEGTALLLLVIGTRSNALATGSTLGRDIGVFPNILYRSGSLWRGGRCRRWRRAGGLGLAGFNAGSDCWLGLLSGGWPLLGKRHVGVRVDWLRVHCLSWL
jgi:hypothetical protein